jgi:hypothetical protein
VGTSLKATTNETIGGFGQGVSLNPIHLVLVVSGGELKRADPYISFCIELHIYHSVLSY